VSWEAEVAAAWGDASLSDDDRVERMRALASGAPHPSLALFELGSAFDGAGREAEAEACYRRAADAGLAQADPTREAHRRIQHASTLRNLGRCQEAIAMLRASPDHPEVGTAREAFLALALHSAGRPDEALRVAIEALIPTMPLYRRALTAYAAELTEQPRPEPPPASG
jgi:tetratricopeptide (TPR) repeat protein